MKSLSINQMAATTGNGQLFCDCPTICQSAFARLKSSNPVLAFMANAIWSGRACRSCNFGYDGYCGT